MAQKKNAPDTLPADFDFSSAPDTLPANFDFGQSTKPATPIPDLAANPSLTNYGAAQAQKYGVKAQPITQFEQERDPNNHQNVLSSLGSAVSSMPSGMLQLFKDKFSHIGGRSFDPQSVQQPIDQADQALQQDQARKKSGYGLPYRFAALAAGQAGANIPEIEHQSDIGNPNGVLGQAVAPLAAMEAARALGAGANVVGNKISGSLDAARTSAVRSQFPAQTAQMPAKGIIGTEGVFRAAAPVGGDPQFRQALYETTGDLADIGKKIDLSESKGGILQPDMRVRATVNAVNDHLQEMYQNERAPQIARNAQNPVPVTLDADAKTGLNFLAQSAGLAEDRALAAKALKATPENPLTLAETDQLAKVANKELVPYSGMTPTERALTESGQMRYAGLSALDKQLGNSIAQELGRRGEAGLAEYEKRYATLSQVRDQLQSRMNMSELQRKNPVLWAKAMAGGAKGMAGASMSATSNVNLGAELQRAFRNLADSGMTAKKGVPGTAPTIRGLLPEATGGPFEQPVSDAVDAQRMIQNGSLPQKGMTTGQALDRIHQWKTVDPTQQRISDLLKLDSNF